MPRRPRGELQPKRPSEAVAADGVAESSEALEAFEASKPQGHWYSAETCVELGVTIRQLQRLGPETNAVERQKIGNVTWYNGDQIDQYLARKNNKPEATPESFELLRSMNATLMGHLERTMALVFGPSERHLALLQATNEALSKRCVDLEGRHIVMLEMFEKLMTAHHERELEVKVVAAREGRRDQALDKLTQAAPGFFSQLLASFGARNLLASIDDDQLSLLVDTEFLKPEQREVMRAEQKRRAAAAAARSKSANGKAEGKEETHG